MKRKREARSQKSEAPRPRGAGVAPVAKPARGTPSGDGPRGPSTDGPRGPSTDGLTAPRESRGADEPRGPSTDEQARPLCANVTDLSDELRGLVETMLVDGGTFEDVVEAVKERGKEQITLHAVQNFFRSNLGLQQQRIKRQRETAQALRQALGDPASGQQELADAILMTGLMRVSRRGSEFSAKDAVYEKYERENLRLKQELSKQKEQKLRLDKRIALTRWKSEQTRTELARARLLELQQMLDARKGQQHLGPETLQKIQEIYGLIGEQNQAAAAGQ